MTRKVRSPSRGHETFNVGVRLYQKGVKRQEEKERFCKQVREVEEMLKERELIFKPQLVARQLPDSGKLPAAKAEELLLYGRMINEKKEMARFINTQYEDTRFAFVPKINKKSERIVSERGKYGEAASPTRRNLAEQLQHIGQVLSPQCKFQELYDEARQRRERQERVSSACLDKECTFRPRLVTKDSKLSKTVLQECAEPDNSPKDNTMLRNNSSSVVFERLSHMARNEKRNLHLGHSVLLASSNAENIDPKTGQPLFRPQTGRSPKLPRELSKTSIGEHLYQQRKALEAK